MSADDRARLIQFERQTRDVVPLAQDVGREAADIAVTALGEVAAGFSRSPDATRAQLANVRAKIDARLKQSFSKSQLTPVDIDDDIGALVAEMLPQLIGDVVAGAVQSAMTGNDVQLRSLDGMEARIERLVEPQARALRPRAQQLASAWRRSMRWTMRWRIVCRRASHCNCCGSIGARRNDRRTRAYGRCIPPGVRFFARQWLALRPAASHNRRFPILLPEFPVWPKSRKHLSPISVTTATSR